MIAARVLTTSIAAVLVATPSISAQDLSSYRDFRLGMSLAAVAEHAGLTPEGHVSLHPSGLRLVVSSKRLGALARTATVEAIRLDEQEAPQRESARQRKRAEENRVRLDKARRVNKPTFRP